MQQLLTAGIILAVSFGYVTLLSGIAITAYSLQKAVVFPVILLTLVFYFSSRGSWRKMLLTQSRWLMLFLCTILIHLTILSTGGLKSPFLILIHLFTVGLGFMFSFSVALLFLLSSFGIITSNLLAHHALIPLLQNEPTFAILQFSSLISIIPVVYIVAQHYHFKDVLLKESTLKAAANQAILESLDELIIITDLNYNILSANDAVTRLVHKSKTQLIDAPIFDILFLKDNTGKLVSKTNFGLKTENATAMSGDFMLMKTSLPQQKITLHAQTITDPEGKPSQISFIISNNEQVSQSQYDQINLKKARALYEALAENLKKELLNKDLPELYTKILILAKFENDIYQVQTLKEATFNKDLASIDLAQLCKQIIVQNQDFSQAFRVPTDFAIHNFSMVDVEPLLAGNVQLSPEQFTGPFFTAQCDPKYLEVVIKKLIDLSILLAATQQKPQVILSVERGDKEDIIVSIAGRAPTITDEEIKDVFAPYYGKLSQTTNLHAGSGLEGYLAKAIIDGLKIPLDVKINNALSTISFTLRIPKKQTA
jgi:PAS domain-containing protein